MPRKVKMNKITSPEKIAMINKDNIQLMEDFLAFLKSQKKSQGTIRGYRSDLLIFFTFVLEELDNKNFRDVNKRDIVRFQNKLLDRENSSARVRRIKAAVSSLSNFCEEILSGDDPEYDKFRSIVNKIKNPPLQPAMEKVVWEPEEVEQLIQVFANGKRQDIACFVALALYSGRRKAELCKFKVSDFSPDKLVCDGALYKSDLIKTKGQGGGKFINCYVLAKQFDKYLGLWLKELDKRGVASEWLFPQLDNPSEHIIEDSTANSWAHTVDRLAVKMFGKNWHPHAMRHTFTTMLYKAGIPESVIQSIIHWESADMVKVYLDVTPEEQIGMYFKNGEIVAPEQKGLSDL